MRVRCATSALTLMSNAPNMRLPCYGRTALRAVCSSRTARRAVLHCLRAFADRRLERVKLARQQRQGEVKLHLVLGKFKSFVFEVDIAVVVVDQRVGGVGDGTERVVPRFARIGQGAGFLGAAGCDGFL